MSNLETKVCPICGIEYAAPALFFESRLNSSSGSSDCKWYCPNGHSLIFTDSDADKMRRQRDRLQQKLAEKDDEIEHFKRSAAARLGEVTKLKRRAGAGICPCCSRQFTNLKRHMSAKHPDYSDTVRPDAPLKVVKGGKS